MRIEIDYDDKKITISEVKEIVQTGYYDYKLRMKDKYIFIQGENLRLIYINQSSGDMWLKFDFLTGIVIDKLN